MVTMSAKCPYCKTRNTIEVEVVEVNNHPLTAHIAVKEPYITCQGCMDVFKVEIALKAKVVTNKG